MRTILLFLIVLVGLVGNCYADPCSQRDFVGNCMKWEVHSSYSQPTTSQVTSESSSFQLPPGVTRMTNDPVPVVQETHTLGYKLWVVFVLGSMYVVPWLILIVGGMFALRFVIRFISK